MILQSFALVVHHLRTFGLGPTLAKVLRRLGLATGYRRWRRCEPSTVPGTSTADIPRFSIVVPVFFPRRSWLRSLVRSVRAQSVGDWELILAGSWGTAIARDLRRWSDPRIRPLPLAENGGIAGNTNAAAAAARGAWVGFLDHDDTLAPFALEAVAQGIERHTGAHAFYSDEDKLTPVWGRRVLPFLKPQWSPETLLSYNYVCHFLVVRRTVGEELGWLRAGFEGAQDYDFALRLAERGPLVHLVGVLYHWRMAPGSTAGRPEAKLYAYDSAKRALREHLARTGRQAEVEDGASWGTYRVRYILTRRPLVSVIIPTRDQGEVLQRCVRSLLDRTDYSPLEVLVAENGSRDPRTEAVYASLLKDERVRLCPWSSAGGFNYAAINNDTVREHARGEVLVFLNNDMEIIDSSWLQVLVERALQPGVGAVGAKLVYPDGALQHGGIVVGIGGYAGHPFKGSRPGAAGYYSVLSIDRNVSAVTGACLAVTRRAFDAVGGFDPAFALAANDVDFCLRLLQAGYRNVWTPWAALVHDESKTRGHEDTPEKRARFASETQRFRERWAAFLEAGDPSYHPGLTLESEDWSLSRSPRVRR